MLFREVLAEERESVFQMGYKEWAKGRTFNQYVLENEKEDDYGIRYAYVDKTGKIIGSLIVLSLQIKLDEQPLPFYGLGSIVIDRDYREKGYGGRMINECLSYLDRVNPAPIMILYSDIQPTYYEQFSFRKLPPHLQRYPHTVCMIRCSQSDYDLLVGLKKAQIPAYF